MRDKISNSDYVEYLRQASKWNEQHNNAYSNLCSEIALPNSTMETTILRTQEPEDDNSALLLM